MVLTRRNSNANSVTATCPDIKKITYSQLIDTVKTMLETDESGALQFCSRLAKVHKNEIDMILEARTDVDRCAMIHTWALQFKKQNNALFVRFPVLSRTKAIMFLQLLMICMALYVMRKNRIAYQEAIAKKANVSVWNIFKIFKIRNHALNLADGLSSFSKYRQEYKFPTKYNF